MFAQLIFVVRKIIINLDIVCQDMGAILLSKEELTMQESRLFKIVYHLLDKGQATAPELAKKIRSIGSDNL